jgi:hypothetical protein
MTTDRSADAAARNVLIPVLRRRNSPSVLYEQIIVALARAGFEIRERRSEPVVYLPYKIACQIRDDQNYPETKRVLVNAIEAATPGESTGDRV